MCATWGSALSLAHNRISGELPLVSNWTKSLRCGLSFRTKVNSLFFADVIQDLALATISYLDLSFNALSGSVTLDVLVGLNATANGYCVSFSLRCSHFVFKSPPQLVGPIFE